MVRSEDARCPVPAPPSISWLSLPASQMALDGSSSESQPPAAPWVLPTERHLSRALAQAPTASCWSPEAPPLSTVTRGPRCSQSPLSARGRSHTSLVPAAAQGTALLPGAGRAVATTGLPGVPGGGGCHRPCALWAAEPMAVCAPAEAAAQAARAERARARGTALLLLFAPRSQAERGALRARPCAAHALACLPAECASNYPQKPDLPPSSPHALGGTRL